MKLSTEFRSIARHVGEEKAIEYITSNLRRFLKERDKAQEARCLLDIAIFETYFIPHFRITHRYVGTEPYSSLTARYNEALKAHLTIPLREIPRLEQAGKAVSASAVRADLSQCQPLLPESSYQYLKSHGLLP